MFSLNRSSKVNDVTAVVGYRCAVDRGSQRRFGGPRVVAALVTESSALPASSVKDTLTLMVLPTSAATTV